MQYQLTKCPHCGNTVEFKSTGWNDLEASIGSPTGFCFKCRHVHATGKKYWHQMDASDRTAVWLRIVFGGIIGGLFFGMGFFMLWMFLLGGSEAPTDTITQTLFVCFTLGIPSSFAWHLYRLKTLIDRDAPKENNGDTKPNT